MYPYMSTTNDSETNFSQGTTAKFEAGAQRTPRTGQRHLERKIAGVELFIMRIDCGASFRTQLKLNEDAPNHWEIYVYSVVCFCFLGTYLKFHSSDCRWACI